MTRICCSGLMGAMAMAVMAGQTWGTEPLVGGNIAVVRIGHGNATLTNAGTAVFIDEYTLGGALVQSIALPTTVNGSQKRLVISGTSTSEGYLGVSANGQYLLLAGYDADAGTAGISGTTATAANRVIARVGRDGGVNTSTALSDAYNLASIRSVASDNGERFWTAGAGGAAVSGVRFVGSLGATTSVQLSTTVTNTRVVNVMAGQLYVSSASGSFQGVSKVGTGLPTTSGQVINLLPGLPTSAGPSAYDFVLVGESTLYVADDRTNGSGGVQKWTLNGGTWTLAYTVSVGTSVGVRAVDQVVDCEPEPGDTLLVATTTDNRLVRVLDTGSGATASVSLIAAAGTNRAFRGVRQVRCIGEPNPCPTINLAGPADVTVNEPGLISLTVTPTPDLPTGAVLQWKKNGTALANGATVSGVNTLSLAIAPSATADAGTYQLVITFPGCATPLVSRQATVAVNTPPPAGCNPADITGIGGPPAAPDGLITGDDFTAFINAFAEGGLVADITGIGGPPATPDGLITGDDFTAFINAFAEGCP